MNIMSFDEKKQLFKEIHEQLIKPFPQGTVVYKGNNRKSAFIPVQAYINRVNEVAGHLSKWRITTPEAIIHPDEKLIEMRGILQILDTEYEGVGFADYDVVAQTGAISFKGEVIRSAVSHAFVDACNKFQIGWIDLNRDWSTNAGTGVPQRRGTTEQVSEEPAIYCIMPNCTNTVDKELLAQMNWKINHCPEHIPSYQRKKFSHVEP